MTGNDTIGCRSSCTTLTANLVGDVPINCSIGTDDIYSTPFSLGFTFNFYGTPYTQILVGANGNLNFDLTLSGAYDPWPITAALLGNSSVYNCICGPWCDIDYADFGGSCWYSTDGVAPNRKFVVSFCKTYMYNSSSCPGQFTTTQIILYETTNIIEVHIAHKTICSSWNGGHAICGVQNATGTAATAAPARDWTPNWTATDEAWRFTPTGGGTAYTAASIPFAPVPLASSKIYWYDSSTYALIDSGATITVCPTTTTTYKAGALGCADTSFGYRTVVVQPCGLLAVSNYPCIGDSLKLDAIGDSTGATYSWILIGGGVTATGQTPSIFPSTWADTGTYRVVRTIGALNDTSYVHVLLHPLPVINLSYNAPLCSALTDTLRLTESPDSTGETFVWSGPGAFTSTLQNPTWNGYNVSDTGIFKVVATTRYGCKDSATIDVGMLTPPSLTTDSPLVKTCVGIPVTLHVYPNPAVGSYIYAWTPGTFLSSTVVPNPVVTPTIPGDVTYTVSVGLSAMPTCLTKDTIHVHVLPNDFTLANPDTVICRGQSVQVRVSGGSPEFNWLWTPPTGVSNTTITNPIITPPTTNTYTLTASYAHCPNMVHSFKITVDTPAIPVTISDTICLGMTQNVNLTFPGYNFYHFLWTPPTYISNDTSAIVTINPLAVGNYTYTVSVYPGTNPAGCSVNDIVNLHVAPNDFILGNPDTIICRGQSVVARVTGSTEFAYLWTPPTGVSNIAIQSPTLTPNTTTTYSVTASYSPHCPDMHHSFTITVDTPAIPVVIHDTICLGMVDNVNLTFAGSSFYHFVWTPTTYVGSSTSAITSITPLVVGDYVYSVTVSPGTSPAGCTVMDIDYLHVAPNDFTLSNDDTAICLGNSIQAVVAGSTEFKYKWTPVAGVSDSIIMQPLLTPTTSTTYTVTASYAPHCPDMVHHFYIEVDTLAIPVTIFDTTCLGIPDSVNLTFPGSGNYKYVWAPATNVSNSTSPIVALVPPVTGTYNWTVNVSPKALNCSVNDVVNLLVVPNSFTIAPTDTTICIGNTVQMRGVPYPLFSYQWIPTSGIPISNIINPQITPDTSTIYVVTASYSRCPLMHDTLRLMVEPNPSVYVGGNRFLCEYDTVHMTATVSPGWYNNYSYSWTPSTSLFESTTQTVVFKDTLTEKVVVVVTTPNGCKGSDSALVTVYSGNFLGIVGNRNFCPGDSAKLTATGGSQYYWTPTMYLTDSVGVTTTVHPITSGVYTIVGTNSNGCKDTAEFDINVYPAATIYMPDTAVIFPGESYAIVTQSNCSGFNWTPVYGLDQSNISNPVAMPDVSTKYHVTATTENGCVATDSITIFVDPQTLLAVPNAFTPGNGPNSEFKIIKRGIATLNSFRIYDRWGILVYESNNIDAGWNGNYKGALQPMGVYVYEIEAVTSTGKYFTKQGNLTLIR